MVYSVYKINFPNGKFYIGCTKKTIEKRLSQHINDASNNSKIKVHEAIRECDYNVSVELLDTAETHLDGFSKEIQYIEKFNSCVDGYNVRKGGNYLKVNRRQEEFEEIDKKKGKAGENNPFYGKTHTKDSLDRMVAKRMERGSYEHLKDPATNPLCQPHVIEKSKIRMTEKNPMKDPIKIQEKLDKTAQRYGFKDNEELILKIKTLHESGMIRSEIVKKLNITKDILNPRLRILGLIK